MTKENNSNINKLIVTLGQTKSVQQKEFLSLSAADYEERLLKEALDQPRKEEERARERAVKHLTDQINGRGIFAKQLADRESELKRQIEEVVKKLSGPSLHVIQAEFLKTFFPNPRAYFEEERLKSAKSWAETKKNLQEIENDSERAKKLLSFAGEFQDINLSDGLKIIEDELRENGALTSRQLVFLIAEYIDKYQIALIETAKKVIEGCKKNHEALYGTKVEKENERAMWQAWVDTEIAKYPNKKAHSFEFIKSLVVKNHPDNVSTSQLKRYTKDSR